MMDIVRAVQGKFGCVSSQALDLISAQLGVHRVEVEGVVSFYAFLSTRPKGKIVIRVCNDVIDELKGSEKVAETLSSELGIEMGGTSKDGKFSLEYAPCIGMSDQAPAALVNDVVITNLNSSTACDIARKLKAGAKPEDLITTLGDGNNAAGASALEQMRQNIRKQKRSAPANKIPPKAQSVPITAWPTMPE
jgi:[NiFe] hydrogenase diaphorase moiety large subunit